jgi:hypothetical protein
VISIIKEGLPFESSMIIAFSILKSSEEKPWNYKFK